MSPLKEFADFVTLNMASLAGTYAQSIAEKEAGGKVFPALAREASARKALRAVVEALKIHDSEPVIKHFGGPVAQRRLSRLEGAGDIRTLVEIECLAQTLTPVVTNLEAGKFLWRVLSEARDTAMPATQLVLSGPASEQDMRSNYEFDRQAAEAAHEKIRILKKLVSRQLR